VPLITPVSTPARREDGHTVISRVPLGPGHQLLSITPTWSGVMFP
jgi:hypothetical protein